MRRTWIVLSCVLVPTLAWAAFPDVGGHPHEPFVETLRAHGVVGGYPDGYFRPNNPINRAEFLKIVMLSAFGDEVFAVTDKECFADFVGAEQWFWKHACAAKERGIIHGYPDGTFRGETHVNFAEALKISFESYDVAIRSVGPSDNWYDPYLDAADDTDVYDYFVRNPSHRLTRSEMATVIANLRQPIAVIEGSEAERPRPEEPSDEDLEPGICGDGIRNIGEQCDDGNISDGDGCSSICVIVTQPLRHGAMRIDQRSGGAVGEAGGAQGVGLIAFDAIAGRQDIYITGLKFEADVGDLSNAYNYRLYIDSDGDNMVDTQIASEVPHGNVLAFGGLNILVREGYYSRVQLRADMHESTTPFTLGVAFKTDDPEYVEAVDRIDGRDLTGIETDGVDCGLNPCWIAVHTKDTHIVSVAERGDLYVTKSNVSVPSSQMLAGERSDVLLRLNFFADDEDIEVEDIRIGGGNNSIDYLEFFEEGEDDPFATARVAACAGSGTTQLFCAKTSLVIGNDEDVDVLVRAVLNDDTEGAISGDAVALTVASSITEPAIEARGLASQQDLSQNDGDGTAEGEIFIGRNTPGDNNIILGPTHDVVFSKIASITNNGDLDNTAVPVGVTPIAKFRVEAEPHSNSNNGYNTVSISKMVFTVNAQNVEVQAGSFQFYNTLDSSTMLTCGESATTGNITVTCSGISGSVSAVVPQGGSMTLALQTNILNPQSNSGSTSTLQVSLNQLDDRNLTGTIEWNDDENTFLWVDLDETYVKSTTYRNN